MKDEEKTREQLQAAIKKSALEWRMTVDAVESLILMLDYNGRIKRLNRAAKELAGDSYEELLDQTVEAIGPYQPWQKAAEIVSLIRQTRCATSVQVKDESSGRTWDIAASLSAGPEVDEE